MYLDNPKTLFFVTIEMAPFFKLTGMADLLHSLVGELSRRGHNVNVIMPEFERHESVLNPSETISLVSSRSESINLIPVKCARDKRGVKYFMVHDQTLLDFLGRMSHGDPGTGQADVWLDFSYISYLILNVLLEQPNSIRPSAILHAFHWQTGPLLALLARHSTPSRPRNVFTVDILDRQGRFNPGVLEHHEIFHFLAKPTMDEVNFMKIGIESADMLHTVSPSYAIDIQRSPNGRGLEELLRQRYKEGRLKGILNGIDPALTGWDCIPIFRKTGECASFLPDDLTNNKRKAKKEFQKAAGLPVDPDAFLISMGHRFARQKNFDLVAHSIDGLMEIKPAPQIYLRAWPEPTQGHHDWDLWWTLIRKSLRYRHNVAFLSPFDRDRSLTDEGIFIDRFLYYAASDLFLMPSLWEPCGLCQLEAMRFGALPVVSAVGGLVDTVKPYDEEGNGWGFLLQNVLDQDELINVIRKAISIRSEEPSTWEKMLFRAIEFDSSIKNSVDSYLKLLYDLA